MEKRGDIWISAVLYIALGIILITIILSAGIPLMDKLKDRNTVVQTKNMLNAVDQAIRAVVNEGPGSKRYLSPINIDRGDFIIDEEEDAINWSLKTTNKMMEEGTVFEEGSLNLYLEPSVVRGEYLVVVGLKYADFADLNLVSDYGNPFRGSYSMTVNHTGQYTDYPIIDIGIY